MSEWVRVGLGAGGVCSVWAPFPFLSGSGRAHSLPSAALCGSTCTILGIGEGENRQQQQGAEQERLEEWDRIGRKEEEKEEEEIDDEKRPRWRPDTDIWEKMWEEETLDEQISIQIWHKIRNF